MVDGVGFDNCSLSPSPTSVSMMIKIKEASDVISILCTKDSCIDKDNNILSWAD